MRIAIFTSVALDREDKERDAAVALSNAVSDHGAEVLLVGTAGSASLQTAGRLTIRALERSGASALAHTGSGARELAVSGPVWTWAADAATRRVIGQGDLDLVVLVGDDETPLANVVLDAAPSTQRVGLTGTKKTAKEVIAIAGDHARRPSPLVLPEPLQSSTRTGTSCTPLATPQVVPPTVPDTWVPWPSQSVVPRPSLMAVKPDTTRPARSWWAA